MKIKITDDEGRELPETAITTVLKGQWLIICPSDAGFFPQAVLDQMAQQLEAIGVRAAIFPSPVEVWAVADDAGA